ncbi:MAG: hypothetical protein Q9167_006970 [Letrouitia subvulpina]
MDLSRLASVLEASLDPNQNKQAETVISQEEKKPGFSDDVGTYKLPAGEVSAIKRELIGLMISVPANIQYQLGDAIGVIADSDFWERWDTLVDDLVSRLTPDNPRINNGVLQVAHSIFKRWRPLYRSDELFTEINHVLGKFGGPYLALLENTDRLIDQNQANQAILSQLFSSLNLLMKLLYDLSVQDLPPIFEDSLQSLTSLLHKYLTYDNPLLRTEDENEAGPLEFVKSGVFEVLGLYVHKYEDVFDQFVGQFIESSWNLLTTVGPETKYDILISKSLHFLTLVTRTPGHARSFNSDNTVNQVVDRVIIPNLTLRDSDVELFEDEPIEFIRRDLEGSDSDTRRRAATDFLQQLLAQFQKTVTEVVIRYVNHYLSEFSNSPSVNWKSKDTALYLFSSVAAKGAVTASQGVKSVNEFLNVVEFFQSHIAGDLVSDSRVEPILKVDAIKYLYIFRSQISRDQWREAFPLLVKHLGSSDYVVYTYAAVAVERVLALTNDQHQPIVSREDVSGLSSQLLQHLFSLIERNLEPAKIQENEFLMRCIMRVLIVIREGVAPVTDTVLAHFIKITQITSHNPSNPRFTYYHFEALGAFIRFASPSQASKLENGLYPLFSNILQNDVQEFSPYVFQLLSALLESNPSRSLPDYYISLIQPILAPELWVSKGNIPALVRLLSSILQRGSSEILRADLLKSILDIFQQLVSTKANEIYGFELLESIVANIPREIIGDYFGLILQALLTRLQNSKTDAFALRFVRFYYFIAAKDDKGLGADFFITLIDQFQSGLFVQLYLNIILPETERLVRMLDRKTAVIALTKTITHSHAFTERYKKGWAYSCEALLKLLKNPPIPTTTDETIADQDVDDMSFGVGFTQLQTIKRPPRDDWSDVSNVKTWVAEQMQTANARGDVNIVNYANERLSPEIRQLFSAYTGL